MGEAIAFVYPYIRDRKPIEREKLFPPLGIASLKSQVLAQGLNSRIHDGTFSRIDEIVKNVERQQPAIVGIYAMLTMSRNALDIAREIRNRLPGTLLVAGGPLPTLYPERFLSDFDLVLRGEADLSFAGFCSEYLSLCAGREDLGRVGTSCYPGITWLASGGIAGCPPIHNSVEVLDSLPIPDRSCFDHDRYKQFWKDTYGYTQTSIIITRGCPFLCDFCSKPVWGQFYRKPSLERVFTEISDILRYDYERLWIADDSFTLDTRYLRSFCEHMIRADVPVRWSCLSRVDRLSRDLVRTMHNAGCFKVYLGLESGSNLTLRLMGKKATVEEGIRAVSLFQEAGIETSGFFIVGYPGETDESVQKTLSLALSLPLDEISINVPFPLPGSPLFERVSGLDPDADWDMANETRFVYCADFDEEDLRERITTALSLFEQEKRERKYIDRLNLLSRISDHR